MQNIATIGFDIAKNVFQAHGADADGRTLFNRKLRRSEVKDFFQSMPPSTVAMEACGSSYHWAREISAAGHQVRLLPAQIVKPLVPRGKTDANDAVAINEALRRPNVRFVPIKSADQQGASVILRIRRLMIRQRTKAINALRSHLAEFGLVANTGTSNVSKLLAAFDVAGNSIPTSARTALNEVRDEIRQLDDRIQRMDSEIASQAKLDADIMRLTTIPGVGKLTAATIKAHVPDPEGFGCARNFAAWIGLTPRSNSSGPAIRTGHISRMGHPELRNLLYMCATSAIREARRTDQTSPWLRNLIARKPPKVAAIALANKVARIVWALLTKGGTFRAPMSDPQMAQLP